jgi:site-specific DNA recombinase
MRASRLWGWREYQGELTAKGDWPAIISEVDGRALRQLLDRPPNSDAGNRRRHLLSGLVYCGRCGGRMRVGKNTNGQHRYTCFPVADGGCGGCSILLEPTDEAVEAMVLAQFDTPDMAATLAARQRTNDVGDEAELLAELARLERLTETVTADHVAGRVSRAAWMATQRAVDQETELLSARLADSRRAEPLDALAGASGLGLADRYRGLSLERRRRVISALIDRVVVLPVDDPVYRRRLADTLAVEADEYRTAAADLRAKANEATDPAEVQRLRKAAEKADQDARRRLRQIRSGASGASRFRVERLEPAWRT